MAEVNFTAWLKNEALSGENQISYPFITAENGFAPGSTLDAGEFNGAFRMMSVVAAAIMNEITGVTPNSSVVAVDNAIKTKIGNIPANTANTANKLATARTLQVNLESAVGDTFDGSANATDIGVAGILSATHGGTGKSNLMNVAVGYAGEADTSKTIEINGTAYTLSLSNTTLTLTAG